MIAVNKSAVPAPTIHPFSFALTPDINPPMNRAKKETIRMNQLNEASVKELKDKINEMIKLNAIAITNILTRPYSIDPNIPRYAKETSPLTFLLYD